MNLHHDGARSVHAAIFDMDGILCDSEGLMAKAAARMFQEHHGVVVNEEDFLPFVGTGEANYLGSVARQYGVDISMPADKDAAYRMFLDMIPGQLTAMPGAAVAVATARGLGMRTAVATGADRIKLTGALAEIGIAAARFDALLTGSDISRPKPDPEIFVKAAAALDLPPRSCLVFEDSLNGLQAAIAAGCRTAAVATTMPRSALEALRPDHVLEDMTHASVLLSALHGGD